MHAPDDSTTPSRSVTVMRRLIRPWEYRHVQALFCVNRMPAYGVQQMAYASRDGA